MALRTLQQQLDNSTSYEQYKNEVQQPMLAIQQIIDNMLVIRMRAESLVRELTAQETGPVLNGLGNERWFAMFKPNKMDPDTEREYARESMPAAIRANAPEFGWHSSIDLHRSGQAHNLPVEPKR